MKLHITPPSDGRVHMYCLRCYDTKVVQTTVNGRLMYSCSACKSLLPRALVIDPTVLWWTDPSGEYCHAASGVFLHNHNGEFLFFDRTRYPFGLTVPAGHIDVNEQPATAAVRELKEETSVTVQHVTHIATHNIVGDECHRGADVHRWHAFAARLPVRADVKVNSKEGLQPVWLTLEQAMQRNPTFATAFIIQQCGTALLRF